MAVLEEQHGPGWVVFGVWCFEYCDLNLCSYLKSLPAPAGKSLSIKFLSQPSLATKLDSKKPCQLVASQTYLD
jgi:hypothetical protein